MSSSGVAGVVLAAGQSERMGTGVPKQLLRFGERTMAAVVVATAEASRLDEVIVVTGRAADEVAASLPAGRHTVVDNPDYQHGNLTSLRAGVSTVGSSEAVVVLLADMPEVTTDAIDALIALWNDQRPWAIITEYGDGMPNHPFLLSTGAVAEALAGSGPKPLWRLLVDDPPHPVARLQLTERPPVDVDTPDDYTEALRRRRPKAEG